MLVVAVASFHSCAFGTSYCAGGFGSQLWGSIHLYEGFCFVERGISTTPRACNFGFIAAAARAADKTPEGSRTLRILRPVRRSRHKRGMA